MGLNYRRRQLVSSTVLMNCKLCQKVFPKEAVFCPDCGNKLTAEKSEVYANFGKHGISSFSIKLPNGITINSKKMVTVPLAKGLSYTIKP